MSKAKIMKIHIAKNKVSPVIEDFMLKEEFQRIERKNGEIACKLYIGLNKAFQPLAVYKSDDNYKKQRGMTSNARPPFYYKFHEVHYLLETYVVLNANLEIQRVSYSLYRPSSYNAELKGIECTLISGKWREIIQMSVCAYAQKRCVYRNSLHKEQNPKTV